ncbi:uncharacterized protein Z518_10564 [Rhinocladiella mackenziei CBS 650.93]|uniref:Rhinocladiella mackenziei CBS 650.93 unplaced genomic scaffold supercont1.9, whole genome shotgun sequence n=1 Tax=Rhinocladiella mackenziei CBS 650.93 TaxID=1442369 RepID=A0A0D2IUN0_9EURO|nr:uncharacterized protein Z518_10564 [Rhinocladiella mackenziei CBS 650.93]KIX00425.1 hypothetical protein Z518_10564 [Rhinocladiella mackenziei CBS 650.93]
MSKPDPTPTPTRNTLNQRASRARRKTYINDLERRVREFEAQGVKATEQVQVAARRVAAENRSLREEVRVLRERNAELERILAEKRSDTGLSPGAMERELEYLLRQKTTQRPQRSRRGVAKSPSTHVHDEASTQYPSPPGDHEGPGVMAIRMPYTTPNTSVPSPQAADAVGPDPHIEPNLEIECADANRNENQDTFDPGTVRLPSSPSINTLDDVLPDAQDESIHEDDDTFPFSKYDSHRCSTKPTRHSSLYSPMSPAPSRPHCAPMTQPNSTPCAQAALIIASMRGLSSMDSAVEMEILPELGCSTARTRGSYDNGNEGYMDGRVGRTSALPDADKCAVDNAQLFGILDREREVET